jgi:rhodanese-related sulfurtransferase
MMGRAGKAISFLLVMMFMGEFVLALERIITAEQVQGWMTSGKKVLLIDVRSVDEYREGHIPGAVSIPAEQISAERVRLPRNKGTTLIFYCRGVG